MLKNESVVVPIQVAVLVFALLASSCSNGNLFGKLNKSGDSSDPEALAADADSAYRNRNYGEALRLFERLLEQQPNNARALFGAANSAVASSGIDFAALLANVQNQTASSASFSTMAEYIHQAQVRSFASVGDPNSILNGINKEGLSAVLDKAICRLKRIVSGQGDGSLDADSVQVLVNLGSLCLIRAAVRPLIEEYLDIQNVNGDYEIVTDTDFDTFCTSASDDDKAFVREIATDLMAAYALFNRAVVKLNIADSQKLIKKLQDDIQEAAEKFLEDTIGNVAPQVLPQACLDILAPTITKATFQSGTFNNDVFTADTANCNSL